MKSSKIIYGSIGFVGLSVMSYFLYKKYGEDEDERDLNNNVKDIQKTYGYTPKPMPNGGGKSRKKKTKSNNKTKSKK
jgi:hypothetical protein